MDIVPIDTLITEFEKLGLKLDAIATELERQRQPIPGWYGNPATDKLRIFALQNENAALLDKIKNLEAEIANLDKKKEDLRAANTRQARVVAQAIDLYRASKTPAVAAKFMPAFNELMDETERFLANGAND